MALPSAPLSHNWLNFKDLGQDQIKQLKDEFSTFIFSDSAALALGFHILAGTTLRE
jgi:hypothetical protein